MIFSPAGCLYYDYIFDWFLGFHDWSKHCEFYKINLYMYFIRSGLWKGVGNKSLYGFNVGKSWFYIVQLMILYFFVRSRRFSEKALLSLLTATETSSSFKNLTIISYGLRLKSPLKYCSWNMLVESVSDFTLWPCKVKWISDNFCPFLL